MQNLLKENAAGRTGKRHRRGALLTGLLYDDRGNRMSPSFSIKNGVRYPFYVSQALLKGRKADAGTVPRIPAAPIETAVLQALGLPDQSQNPQPVANPDLVGTMIEKVVITAAGLTLTYADERPPLHVQRKWENGRDVYGPSECSKPAERDPRHQALIHSIVQAHHWVEMLSSGGVEDIDELAESEGVHPKILRNRLRLAFLPPGVVSAALNHSSSQVLLDLGSVALQWSKRQILHHHRHI